MDQAKIDAVKALNTTTLDELEELKKQYMEKVRTAGQDALKTEFKKFFDENPQVRVVAWLQYTPHFNDGDACEFSVRELNGGCKDLTPEQLQALPKYFEDEGDEDGFQSAGNYESNSVEGWNFKTYGTKYNANAGYPLDPERVAVLDSVERAVAKLQQRLRPHEDLMQMAFGDHAQVIATRDGFIIKQISHD